MSETHYGESSEHVLQAWREELAALGGQDTLLFFREQPEGNLDLGHAHPNGVAGFLAGRPTRLSSLFREEGSLAVARRRARAVSIAGSRLTDEHALPGTHLAVGMVHWPHPPDGPEGVVAPILLRPIRLQPKGVGVADHELDLGGNAWINPALLSLLSRYGVQLDPVALARLAMGSHGFTPRRVLERLSEQTAHLDGLTVTDRIIVGTFIDLAPGLLTDLEANERELRHHPVVRALAASSDGDGAATAAWAAAGGAARTVVAPSPRHSPFSRDWDESPEQTDPAPTLYPLDADQREAVSVAARSDVCVLAPPGTGATQVAAQMVVQAAEQGETVLVVAPRRGELRQLVDRLGQHGLQLLTDEGARSMTVPPVTPLRPLPTTADRSWLHTVHEKWQTTPLHVLQVSAQELSRRSAPPDAPVATRRFPQIRMQEPTLSRLVGVARQRAVEVMTEGLEAGAFRAAARETPWYGADVTTGDEVRSALDLVERLHGTEVPALIQAMRELENQAGLRPRNTLHDWLSQLELLVSVENTLAVFTPAVYETHLDDMIVATATPQWRAQHGSNMSLMDRRRVRKTARELLQPGANPGDIHAALTRAHDEGRRWVRVSPGGGRPRVPESLPKAEAALEQVVDDLGELTRLLAKVPWLQDGPSFTEMPIEALQQRLLHLKRAAQTLRSLPRQARLRAEAHELGLGQLVDQLGETVEVPEDLGSSIETMWCAGVLREMLAERRSAGAGPAPVDQRREEIEWMVGQARSRGGPMATLATALAVPHRLSPADRVDRVLLLGAHRLGLAESVLSVVHGRRLAVIGDPAGARPTGLELGDADQGQVAARRSVLDAAVAALPTVPLRFTHRAPAELVDAADAVLGAGGDLPLAASPRWRVPAPWQERRLVLERVADGAAATRVPTDSGPVEAPETEVRRVVDLVMAHAETAQYLESRGGRSETLGVVALTRSHARRIADQLRLRLRQRPEITEWMLRAGTESFVVTDVARAEDVTRDHIILSVGLGLTPHGAVLHRFGPLDEFDGARHLRSALMRARQRVTVVTCLEAESLDPQRVTTPGAMGLRRLVELAAREETELDLFREPKVADPLLSLLVEGLQGSGADVTVTVADGWPAPDGENDSVASRFTLAPALPDLVVFPADPEGRARPLAVIYDGRTPQVPPAAAVERDARLGDTLTELGWSVVEVRALDLLLARKAVVKQVLGEV